MRDQPLGDTKVCIFIDGLDEYRMIDRMEEYAEKDRVDIARYQHP